MIHTEPELLAGVIKNLKNGKKKVIELFSSLAGESVREVTENALRNAGIPWDILIMGFADTGEY